MSRSQLPSAVIRGSLRDGLLVCLGLLERDTARYEAAAVALAALEALAGPDPVAASRNLCAACDHDGLEELAQVIDAWLERHHPRLLGAGSDGSG
jgi:hypothetical protein